MKKSLMVLTILIAGVLGYRFWVGEKAYEIKNIPITVSRVVCFGNSLTRGYGATQGMDYPARLEEMTGIEIINSGVSGNTTAAGLARLEDDVLTFEPDVVLITLGGNDLKNRVSVDTARTNLIRIIQRIQAAGAMVVLGGIDIPLYGKGYAKMYESLARQTGSVLIPNILEDIFGNPELMSDSIHPNDKGYEIMAGYFYKALDGLPFVMN
ncbi:arylesterase [Desulfobacter hydrogenophilus]|uniref:Arylesterase n=1 Tax=Desulfobacter hydrogenophilus TaxID=2291 RepID=A0A328FAD6_9BACT|nr:arylesterase [Desulfobacter hydrogenophilus]NDY74350.1 arylesterase [Desulfobacter hydrogenophilus]QBH12475.1 arylesterase [Desulfobacter hydrogenophilus]RAM01508.1 arylesterase [Desulfobacter hydrogenophilus]